MTDDEKLARDGRRLALVSVGAAFAFLAVEYLGATLGWPGQVMGLLELAICAVFLWVMIQAIRLWRVRRGDRDG